MRGPPAIDCRLQGACVDLGMKLVKASRCRAAASERSLPWSVVRLLLCLAQARAKSAGWPRSFRRRVGRMGPEPSGGNSSLVTATQIGQRNVCSVLSGLPTTPRVEKEELAVSVVPASASSPFSLLALLSTHRRAARPPAPLPRRRPPTPLSLPSTDSAAQLSSRVFLLDWARCQTKADEEIILDADIPPHGHAFPLAPKHPVSTTCMDRRDRVSSVHAELAPDSGDEHGIALLARLFIAPDFGFAASSHMLPLPPLLRSPSSPSRAPAVTDFEAARPFLVVGSLRSTFRLRVVVVQHVALRTLDMHLQYGVLRTDLPYVVLYKQYSTEGAETSITVFVLRRCRTLPSRTCGVSRHPIESAHRQPAGASWHWPRGRGHVPACCCMSPRAGCTSDLPHVVRCCSVVLLSGGSIAPSHLPPSRGAAPSKYTRVRLSIMVYMVHMHWPVRALEKEAGDTDLVGKLLPLRTN
ncbi:hypothetical protein RJ55_08478 [Drechmeria coniospora]|nr:hypothetical protein RJ55_08478 [Drechmeria coniospora]